MAKVKSIVPLQGSIGEITFLKNGIGTGYRAQAKLVVSKDRFKTSPAFARARENASEFARAGSAGKLLRNSVNALLQDVKDKTRNLRMFQKIMAVIKTDTISPRGHRNLVDGDITLLKKFPFNDKSTLESVFKAGVTPAINRVTGQLTVAVPIFVPTLELTAPIGTTHFQFVSAGSEVDFEMGVFKSDIQKSAQLPYNTTATTAINLASTMVVNSTHPLFLVFGVKFFQQVNGIMYPILAGGFNTLVIVDANKV